MFSWWHGDGESKAHLPPACWSFMAQEQWKASVGSSSSDQDKHAEIYQLKLWLLKKTFHALRPVAHKNVEVVFLNSVNIFDLWMETTVWDTMLINLKLGVLFYKWWQLQISEIRFKVGEVSRNLLMTFEPDSVVSPSLNLGDKAKRVKRVPPVIFFSVSKVEASYLLYCSVFELSV